MSTISTGGQAFPNEGFNGWGEPQQGMTLRDYFAAKAIQGMLAGKPINLKSETPAYAKQAYEIADAMLKARNN